MAECSPLPPLLDVAEDMAAPSPRPRHRRRALLTLLVVVGLVLLGGAHRAATTTGEAKVARFGILGTPVFVDGLYNCTGDAVEADFADLPKWQKCPCAQKEESDGFGNYLALHYCTLDSSPAVSLLICTLWLAFLFFVLAGTADDYLVPALTILADSMQLSGNVAGVTVLALANGAPDLFTSIAAFTGDNAELGVPAILGGCTFIMILTLGVVSIVAPHHTHRRPFVRNVLTYAFSIAFLFYITMDGRVTLVESILFIIVYLAYVVVVIVGRRIFQARKATRLARESGSAPAVESTSKEGGNYSLLDDAVDTNQDRAPNGAAYMGDDVDEMLPEGQSATPYLMTRPTARSIFGERRATVQQRRATIAAEGGKNQGDDIDWKRISGPLYLWHLYIWMIDIEGKNTMGKIIAHLEAPFTLLRKVTIPLIEPETWNRKFALSTMIFYPAMVLLATGIAPWWGYLVSGVVSLPLFLMVYAHTDDKPPTGRMKNFFIFVSFSSACVWTFFIANELISVLTVFGFALNLKKGLLGLVLSMGNSVQDLVGDVVLAKQGHPRMAVAGTFGGPTFNLLIGAGLAFIVATASDYPKDLVIPRDRLSDIGFVVIAIAIVFFVVCIPLNQWKLDKKVGVFLISLYLVYCAVFVMTAVGILPEF